MNYFKNVRFWTTSSFENLIIIFFQIFFEFCIISWIMTELTNDLVYKSFKSAESSKRDSINWANSRWRTRDQYYLARWQFCNLVRSLNGFLTDQSRGLLRFAWLGFVLDQDVRIRLGLRIWIWNNFRFHSDQSRFCR